MYNFISSLCEDHFFDDPYKIIKISNEINFKKSKYISGSRSDSLHTINKSLHNYINNKILKIYYKNIDKKFSANTYFQKSDPDNNDGWVHYDSGTLTAIIYLTPGDTSGTSIFDLKEEFKIPDFKLSGYEKHKYFENKQKYNEKHKKLVFENKIKHNNYFSKTIHYEGKFNRMICFDSNQFHASEVCNKERLILISFIDDIS